MTMNAPSNRSWLRFSLRGMLLFLTLAALWIGLRAEQAHRQRAAARWLSEHEERIVWDYGLRSGRYDPDAQPPAPAWLRDAVGDDYFREPQWISISDEPAFHGDAVRRVVAGTPDLVTLRVFHSPLGNAGAAELTRLERLQLLELHSADVTDAALASIAELPRLKSLELWEENICGPGLAHLARCDTLESLWLWGCQFDQGGLKHLPPLPRLEELKLTSVPLTAAGAAQLAKLPRLRRLELTWIEMDDVAWEALASCTQLEEINLMADPAHALITSAGMKHIAELQNLRSLTLQQARFPEHALAELARMPRLEKLSLRNTQVNDRGAAILADCSQLRRLDLRYTPITETGAARLRRALPQTKIYHRTRP